MTKYDAVFLKHFAQLILGLMAFALVLIIVAHHINDRFYGYSAAAAGVADGQVDQAQPLAALVELLQALSLLEDEWALFV